MALSKDKFTENDRSISNSDCFSRPASEIDLDLLFPREMECYLKQAPSTKTSTHAVNGQFLINQIKSGSSLICFIQRLEYISII